LTYRGTVLSDPFETASALREAWGRWLAEGQVELGRMVLKRSLEVRTDEPVRRAAACMTRHATMPAQERALISELAVAKLCGFMWRPLAASAALGSDHAFSVEVGG
jgi:hypothetical protein